MSKKKANKVVEMLPPERPLGASTGGEIALLAMNVTVDKDDVLAVVESQAEAEANSQIARAVADVARAEQVLKQHAAQLDTCVRQFCENAWAHEQETLRTALESCNKHTKVQFDASGELQEKPAAPVVESACPITKGYVVRCTLQVSPTASGPAEIWRGSVTLRKTLPTTAEMRRLQRQIQKARQTKDEAQQLAYEWKRRLCNIPMLLRQAQATLAKHRLSKSKEGQEILTRLTANLTKAVLALPHN
jgi:hypothetical protein